MKLSLPGNGSTGYTWKVVPGAEPVVSQVGEPQFVSDGKAAGAAGIYTFTFRATGPGTSDLKLICHRPAEAGGAPLQTFGITVAVAN